MKGMVYKVCDGQDSEGAKDNGEHPQSLTGQKWALLCHTWCLTAGSHSALHMAHSSMKLLR